jgi:uncharacterized protein (UPF0548 family)
VSAAVRMVGVTFRLMDAEESRRLQALPLTYPDVGATAAATLPAGYHTMRRVRPLRADQFDSTAEALLDWRIHERAGLSVCASGPVARDGVVRLGIGVGLVRAWALCRVVEVIIERDRVGFAYGTLPGHPESGEEAFLVVRVGDGCEFRITAFSRPATLLARASGPLGRAVQRLVTDRYLAAADG